MVINTYIYSVMAVAAMQGANQGISGVVWGLVSCPRTLQHVDQGNLTNSLPITRGWL